MHETQSPSHRHVVRFSQKSYQEGTKQVQRGQSETIAEDRASLHFSKPRKTFILTRHIDVGAIARRQDIDRHALKKNSFYLA